jgi:hypothetical protein
VLKFDENDVDCERDNEVVVFVRVGDVLDEIVCGDVAELEREVEINEELGSREISIISTTSE